MPTAGVETWTFESKKYGSGPSKFHTHCDFFHNFLARGFCLCVRQDNSLCQPFRCQRSEKVLRPGTACTSINMPTTDLVSCSLCPMKTRKMLHDDPTCVSDEKNGNSPTSTLPNCSRMNKQLHSSDRNGNSRVPHSSKSKFESAG